MAMEYDQKAAGKVHHAAVSRDYISQPRLSMYNYFILQQLVGYQ